MRNPQQQQCSSNNENNNGKYYENMEYAKCSIIAPLPENTAISGCIWRHAAKYKTVTAEREILVVKTRNPTGLVKGSSPPTLWPTYLGREGGMLHGARSYRSGNCRTYTGEDVHTSSFSFDAPTPTPDLLKTRSSIVDAHHLDTTNTTTEIITQPSE